MAATKHDRREYRLIHPRLPADLHDRLNAYGERTHRTQSNAVVHLLEIALRHVGEDD